MSQQRLKFKPRTIAICAGIYGLDNPQVVQMIMWNLQA